MSAHWPFGSAKTRRGDPSEDGRSGLCRNGWDDREDARAGDVPRADDEILEVNV
jgi:hypothetical protein